MARWKLMCDHYLNTPGEEWEYTETDRATGRPIRKKFAVPRHFAVNDPTCWNYKWGPSNDQEGEIIVCYEGRGEAKDFIFIGDPTPDMTPLDDEAREISAKFAVKWNFRPEESSGEFSQSLVDKFQLEMADAMTKPVQVEGLSELVAAIGKLVETNGLAAKSERRV